MGTIRSVRAGSAFRWLLQAYELAKRNPGAVLGGAAWVLLVMLLVTAALAMVDIFVLAGQPMPSLVRIAAGLLLAVPVLLVIAMGWSGYLRLLAAVDAGGDADAVDVFRGFADFGSVWRLFAVMFSLMLVQQLVMFAAVWTFMPEVAKWYFEAVRMGAAAQPPTVLPAGFFGAYGVMLATVMASYAVQAIAGPQVVLGGRPVAAAVRDGVAGVLRNLPALGMFLLAWITAAFLLFVVVIGVVLLLAMVAQFLSVWIALIVAVPLYLLAMIVAFAISSAAAYMIWRDIAAPVAAAAAVEA